MKWNDLLLKKSLYFWFTVLFLGITALAFSWSRAWFLFEDNFVADNGLLGTYGDFVGGVLGTIFSLFSVYFMIRTFSQQREVTIRNEEQLENQRFNDLFFELLHLYQSEVAELCGEYEYKEDGNIISAKYNNKDFFDFEKQKIQDVFQPTKNYESNIDKAVQAYTEFYITNRTKVGACYRTLYRMYDLIDNHRSLKEDVKKNYLKILRAQLTESELFFLRYNAMTYYGQQFRKYLIKYHVLKHLQIFDLLEFKDWWSELDKRERLGINILFDGGRRILRRLFDYSPGAFSLKAPNDNKKYILEITYKKLEGLVIVITINNKVSNSMVEYSGFDKLQYIEIQQLLDCYLKEIFLYSSLRAEKLKKNLVFFSEPILMKDSNNKVVIKSGVKGINGYILQLF